MNTNTDAESRVGVATIDVFEVNGEGLRETKSGKVKVVLTLANQRVETSAEKIPKDKSKSVKWDKGKGKFELDISQPTDHLTLMVYKIEDDGKTETMVGRNTIALNHLPSGRAVEKWYTLSRHSFRNAAIMLVRIHCDLTYSMARNKSQDLGMTLFPAHGAKIETDLQAQLQPNKKRSKRFIDYFLVCGVPPSEARVNDISKPSLLERYPLKDRDDFPLPAQISMFAFPAQFRISKEPKEPITFSFKLTDGMLNLYGQVLTYWSEIPRSHLKPTDLPKSNGNNAPQVEENPNTLYYIPKAMVILSRYPYLPQFRAVLIELYSRFCVYSLEKEEEEDDDWDNDDFLTIDLGGPDGAVVGPNGDGAHPSGIPRPSGIRKSFSTTTAFMSHSNSLNQTAPLPNLAEIANQVKNGGIPPSTEELNSSRAEIAEARKKEREKRRKSVTVRRVPEEDSGNLISGKKIVRIRPKPHWFLDKDWRSLEQYVIMLCDEVPLPIPGRTSVGFQIGSTNVTLSLPPRQLEFPQHELSLEGLFRILDVRTVLDIMSAIYTESQVLFHSSQYSLLLFVQDCILQLCFPFEWEHVYIPLLPMELINILQAPVPFLVGIHSSVLPANLEEYTENNSVIVVDIDRSEIDCNMPPVFFPPKPTRTLQRRLREVIRKEVFHADGIATEESTNQQDRQIKDVFQLPINLKRQREIRSVFLHFIADILKNYRNFVFFVNGERPIFNTPKYLQHRGDSLAFLSRFLETQLFTHFLEKHVEAPGFLDDYLSYIDSHVPGQIRKDTTAFSGGMLTFMVPVAPKTSYAKELNRQAKEERRLVEMERKRRSLSRSSSILSDYGLDGLPLQSLRENLLDAKKFDRPRSFRVPDPGRAMGGVVFDSDVSEQEDEPSIRQPKKGKEEFPDEIVFSDDSDESKEEEPSPFLQVPQAQKKKKGVKIPSRLYIKSLIEQKKKLSECRLWLVLDRLLTYDNNYVSTDDSHFVFDVGELSAVAELLKFETWRSYLVRYFKEKDVHEARCSPDSFKGLQLLFNIAIEEAYYDKDYTNAKFLLMISGKIFQQLNDEINEDRDYLCHAIKQHSLWELEEFWNFSFGEEVDIHKASVNEDDDDYEDQWENFLFDLIGKFTYTMLSMGVSQRSTSNFVTNQCGKYGVHEDQTMTLVTLVGNISLSVDPNQVPEDL